MHRLIGLLGIATMIGVAFLISTNRRAIRPKTMAWGLGLQIAFAFLVMRWQFGQLIFQKAGAAVTWLLDFSYHGSEFLFGDLGKELADGFLFRVPSAPYDHFYRRRLCAVVLLRCDAVRDSASGEGDDPTDGGERRRVAKRGGQHLYGANRSPANDTPVPARSYKV